MSVLELATRAVTLDSQGNYEAAIDAYIEAVQACIAASTRTTGSAWEGELPAFRRGVVTPGALRVDGSAVPAAC